MTIRNAIEAMLQRFKESATSASDTSDPSPAADFVSDDPWLMKLHDRLQRELDIQYEQATQNAPEAQQRIAQILRAFHLMEIGDYGVCTCCNAVISRDRLEADPIRNTCKDCG